MKKINLFFALFFCNICVFGQTTLVSQNFNAGDPPAGWSKFNNSSGGDPSLAAWTIEPDGYTYSAIWGDRTFHSNDNSQFYMSNSDAQGGTTTETILQSPSFSTLGYNFVSLQFYQHFRTFLVDTGYIEVSTNGTTWTTVTKIATDLFDSVGGPDAFAQQIVNLNTYGNNATVSVRFRYYSEGGYYWALDNVTITGSTSALPVSLFTFSGYKEGNHNLLKWSTAFEQNNRGFQLERSADGIGYLPIGFVPSQASLGNSNSLLAYGFTDNFPPGNKQYYRLRQIDLNGNEKLSNIVLIRDVSPKEFIIDAIFPNPTKGSINIFVNAAQRGNVLLQVIDMNGKMLKQRNAAVDTGSNTLSLDASTFMNGVYTVRIISSNGEIATSRFIKQ